MPIYYYKCNKCNTKFENTQVLSSGQEVECPSCRELDTFRIPTSIRANTDTGEEARVRHTLELMEKDLERFQKDDNFAANVTGQSDSKSTDRHNELVMKEVAKQNKAREKIKKEGWKWGKK